MHQLGPALHSGRANVWDDIREGRVLFGGNGDQHTDGVAMIWQINHFVFQPLWSTGQT